MATDKDTVYIDIDDEITGIIDKVRGSDGKVVALVLPKRAAVFQSIVNMKLLKRAAEASKKHLVLITSEAGLLPLAGAAGVHVAKTLTSKPEIPAGPALTDEIEDLVEEAPKEPPEIDPAEAGDQPIGKLAGMGTSADDVETVELDDESDAPAAAAEKLDLPQKPKDKKLQVPDFDRFRLWLIVGAAALLLLIVFLFFATKVLPKATITISTNASNVNASLNLNLSTTAKTLDTDEGTVPAKLVTQQKTYTQNAPATGQKNNGERSAGTVAMTAQACGTVKPANSVPAGTGISRNGLTYITQEETAFSTTGTVSGGCISYSATNSTKIAAQNGGANYNVSSGSFTVAGRSDVSASGSASGGTDNLVKVVAQADIDNAKSKISTDDPAIKKTLQNQLEGENYYAIMATFSSGNPTITGTAKAGDTANDVTVTQAVTYSLFGAKESDLKKLIENDVKGQIDIKKQGILSYGLEGATFNVDSANDKAAKLAMQTTVTVGPDLDIAGIKKIAAGKKSGAVQDELKTNPDVTDVKVKLSPFWVTSVPQNEKKITVTIEKPKAAGRNQQSRQ